MFFHGQNEKGVYVQSTSGVQTLGPNGAAGDQNVLMLVTCTQTFANGSGAQPTFKIGQTDTDNKFAATSEFTNMNAGDKKVYAGTLTAAKDLIVTATAGTGTSTGAITVKAVIIPKTL